MRTLIVETWGVHLGLHAAVDRVVVHQRIGGTMNSGQQTLGNQLTMIRLSMRKL